jgi:hypothetical protein
MRKSFLNDIADNPVQAAVITGSFAVTGSRLLPSEEVDRAFGMPPGKLRHRAGIESLAYAADQENELILGARAAQEALRGASCVPHQLDWIVATSETHHDYPALSAQPIRACVSVKIAVRWTSAAPAWVCSMRLPSRNRSFLADRQKRLPWSLLTSTAAP